jgi:hypothetical protein
VVELAEKLADQLVVRALGDDFDSIASRKDYRFADLSPADEGRQCYPQRSTVEGEAFTDFDGRGFMTDSNECELHS